MKTRFVEGGIRSMLPSLQNETDGTMDEKITEELLAELLSTPSIEAFLDENDADEVSLSAYLQRLLDEKDLKRAEVIRMANLNATFGYQIFTGARGAGRDTILQLAFAM